MNTIKWQKSSFCGNGGNNCLEVATTDDGVLIRESKTPGVVIRTSPEKLRAFVLGVKAGEFDSLTGGSPLG